MKILGCDIGLGDQLCLLAEMSRSHNQSLERAFEIAGAAATHRDNAAGLQNLQRRTLTRTMPAYRAQHIFFAQGEWT